MKISNYIAIFLTTFLISNGVFGQLINIGFRDSIKSNVLNENRKLLIHLPDDYHKSDKDYAVIYRLDGELDIFIETVGVIERLSSREEIMPDMIVVMIENTDRNRDMLPVRTPFYKSEPGAAAFQKFIQTELIPYIESTYRTSNEKILCGQSLSAIYTVFSFLTIPEMFDAYIACSVGFPDCEDYFADLTSEMLKTMHKETTSIFITNGLQDFLDPDGSMNKQIVNFTDMLKLKENINCKYITYQNEGHVPYQSFYHGLKYINQLRTDN